MSIGGRAYVDGVGAGREVLGDAGQRRHTRHEGRHVRVGVECGRLQRARVVEYMPHLERREAKGRVWELSEESLQLLALQH